MLTSMHVLAILATHGQQNHYMIIFTSSRAGMQRAHVACTDDCHRYRLRPNAV